MALLHTLLETLAAALGVYTLSQLLPLLLPLLPPGWGPARSRLPLPPGPPPKPLIGNLLDVPTGHAWLAWAAHKSLYGPISCLRVFGMHIVVLNDVRAAQELFNGRSAVFSDRPRIVFGGEMCGWANTLAMQRYGETFRMFRRELHQVLGTHTAVAKFHPLLEVETRRFLLRALRDTTRMADHVQTTAGAIILRISHGYTIEPRGADPLVALADEGIAQISAAAQPGAFLVDLVPLLRHVPAWFPGASFHATAKKYRATVTELVEKPHAFVKGEMAAGTAAPSYTSALLEKFAAKHRSKSGAKDTGVAEVTPEEDFITKWSASSLYTGGADTTVSAIQTFFLAILLHPQVAARAQAELDSVLGAGPERLPTFEDRENLPYVSAIVKETLRWQPVAPMGLPHVNTEDVIHGGYLIPKGSVVMPNIWQFAHDPDVYAAPAEFRPERFLPEDHAWSDGRAPEPDVSGLVFGFGRRICPGRELADASLFMSVAMSLAVFNFEKGTDEFGRIVEPQCEFTPGTITHPKECRISVVPRSEVAAALVRSVEMDHPWDASDAEKLAYLKWEQDITA